MRDRRIRFTEIECQAEGLRLFSICGCSQLVDEMCAWVRRVGIGVWDVQNWPGTDKWYGFYQVPDPWSWHKDAGAVLVSMDVGFPAQKADMVVELWSQCRFCEIQAD